MERVIIAYPYIIFAGMGIYTYSLFLAAGIITCLMIFLFQNTWFSLRIYELTQSFPLTFGLAVLGGKLVSLITVLPVIIGEHRTGLNAVFSVGFVFYGAFIGLTIGIMLESKRRRKPFLKYTDTFFRLLPLGQAFGRIGCYFNGCCYGKESDAWFAIPYVIDGDAVKVIPTQFMESAFCLVLGLTMLSWRTEKRGVYTFVYLISYSIFRFIIEIFRGDAIRGIWFGLSTSQWISAALICICVIWGAAFVIRRRACREIL